MKTYLLISLGIICIADSAVIPVKPAQEEDILKINSGDPGLFEGDIIGVSSHTRNAVFDKSLLWTLPIPYVIDEQYAAKSRQSIERVLQEFTVRTCVSFTPRTTQDTYVFITRGNACSAGVGMVTVGGSNIVNIGVGCEGHSTITHEILHRLGFWHEQSRHDRDEYVNIIWEKISSANQYNFDKYDNETVDTLGLPYDYVSVMHYKDNAFSIDGSKTITPVDPSVTEIGYQNDVTELDLQKLNALYGCSLATYDLDGYTDFTQWGICNVTCGQERRRWCDGTECDKWGIEHIETQLCSDCSIDQQREAACKGFISGPNVVTSALYPYIYDNGLDCQQTLTVPAGEVVVLHFDALDIESYKSATGYTCPWDYLKIYDGTGTSAPVLASVCHPSHATEVKSTGNAMTIRFKTDGSVAKGGFQIHWSAESESRLFHCNFELGDIQACGFTKPETSVRDWTFKNGKTPSASTGPTHDFSLDTWTSVDTTLGHYIFMETSSPVAAGDTAQLNTPLITATTTTNCVSFAYNMYGSSMGTLNIYHVSQNSTSELIFTLSGNQGTAWKQETVEFHNNGNPYHIMFEAVRGSSWTGDLALDDIVIKKTGCI